MHREVRQYRFMDKALFVQMLKAGHEQLGRHREAVNALNVFPVPDGDTGTNMYLSLTAGIEEISKLPEDSSLGRICHALSEGLLMGARGNSGVILSQLFRGFQLAFERAATVDARLFAKALLDGVQTAYAKVARPVEGTILTVAREAAHAAEIEAKKRGATVVTALRAALDQGERTLAKTPELLSILRQAQVVDSGGQGLMYIYGGFMQALTGEVWSEAKSLAADEAQGILPLVYAGAGVHGQGEYGYCTEFVVRTEFEMADLESDLRAELAEYGDSLLVVASGLVAKVHVHTLHPGKALEAGLRRGNLVKVKIDNMTEQHHALRLADTVPRAPVSEDSLASTESEMVECGLVSVTVGQGLADLFYEAGVNAVVDGGQTMNPSTEDLLEAFRRLRARFVILLPNHPNVLMAAEQAMSMTDGRLMVVPTRSVGQGLGAALAFRSDRSAAENARLMAAAASSVRSGAIAASVRDSNLGAMAIEEGDYVGIAEEEIVAVDPLRTIVLERLIERLCASDTEICTVFCGRKELLDEARDAMEKMQPRFPSVEFEIQFGGQPLYDYLMAAE